MDQSVQFPRSRWLVLLACVIGCISTQVTNLCMAPVLPQIADSLHINVGSATNWVMTPYLLSGCVVMLLIAGVVVDRYGVLVSLILGGLFAAGPALLMPWIGHSLSAIFWARVAEGASQGFIFAAVTPIVAMWFPNHQKGLALGMMSGSVGAGSAIGVEAGPRVFAMVQNAIARHSLGGQLAQAHGVWQTMSAWLSLVAGLGVVIAVVLALMPKPQLPAQAEAAPGASQGALFKQALVSPMTLVGIVLTFAACYGMQCLYNLTPTFLAAGKPLGVGYSAMISAHLMLGVTLLGGVGGPILCGQLLDKVFKGNAKTVFLIGFALMCVFVYALKFPAITGQVALLEAVLIVSGLGVQLVLPTIYYFVAKAYPPQLAGKMSGIWVGIGTFGGVLGVYIAGVTVKSHNSYNITLTLQALTALIGLVLVFALAAAQKPAPSAKVAGAGR